MLLIRRLISLSHYENGISAAENATFRTKELIDHTRIVIVDTVIYLQCSEGGVISTSEVHELHIKIHNILDGAVSK